MQAEPSIAVTRRILVTLAGTPPGQAFISLAVRLATQLHAELAGLFVEDTKAMQSASLPFTYELGVWTPKRQPVSGESMEQSLRVAADAARRVFERVAGASQLPWSFRTVRGSHAQLPEYATEMAEVVLFAPPRWPLLSSVSEMVFSRGPVMVLFDGSLSAQHALQTARSLSQLAKTHAIVILLAPNEQEANKLQRMIGELAGVDALYATIWIRPTTSLEPCAALARRFHAGLLLMGRDCSLATVEDLSALLNKLTCPLGLIR